MKKSLRRAGACLVATLMTMAAVVAGMGAIPAAAQQASLEQPDNYTWLEDIHGERQMTWVKAENARTAAVLEKDSHFAPLEAAALKVLESPDRLPNPQFRNGVVYNTWRDAEHVRGILRRTTLKDYLTAEPKWETVLDYDALSKADKQSWVEKGVTCLHPEDELCLVELSAGGEDAQTLREMNLKTGKFVEGGFVLPRGKQTVAWADKDTLLIARDSGPGTMSEAGYPITIRRWRRGQPLESSEEVFHGDTKDNGYGDNPLVFIDGQDHRAMLVERNLSTFAHESYLLLRGGAKKLALPLKASVNGMLDGQLLVTLDEDWKPEGQTNKIAQGSVIALDLASVEKDPVRLKPAVVFAPTAQEFEQWFVTTKNHMILGTLEHVQQRAYVYTVGKDGSWMRKRLPVPDNLTIDPATASRTDDRFFLGMEGFLTPPSLWLGDAGDGSFALAKSQKPQFDASTDVVEQFEAISKDGTRVPYFVAHRKDMRYDGSNPTLLTAYGGFQIANTPSYSPVNGKLWLERGGVYVLANIRGGGEFGPAWHEAGLKTHRQRIYDDFYAVAEDLVTRKVTSARRLGIRGGSNGGLLMGVEFTQHPEMWNAVVIQVPLLDMLGFEHLSAGASWVGEYGSVSVPEERAFLASISPYNQLKPDVNYPVPLIFTTTKDDRVGPVHARKFAARLEEFHKPFFYDEITEGGHGAGADKKQEARTDAEYFTYLMMKLMDSTGLAQSD
ncbi:MAG TPA: prolyl oligopeptidase family serine peptidase [Candidatus Acidoferrum sp.]|nr:prolyl oligopeptidase family serine peptidase [Candidatus Acidoferrum sp.]